MKQNNVIISKINRIRTHTFFIYIVLIISLCNISSSYSTPSNDEKMIQTFISYYKDSNDVSPKLFENIIVILNSIKLNDLSKTQEYLYQLLPIAKGESNYTIRSDLYYLLGQTYTQKKMYSIALDYYIKGFKELVNKGNLSRVAYSLIDIGNTYYANKNYLRASHYYYLSLNNFLLDKNEYGSTVIYNNLGLIKNHLAQYDSALYFFNKAFNVRKKYPGYFLTCHSYKYIATTYRLMGDFRNANFYILKAISNINKLVIKHSEEKSLIHELYLEYARILKDEKKYLFSIIYYNKSIEAEKKYLNNLYDLINLKTEISEVYLILKKYDEALEFTKRAYSIADSISYLEGIANTSKLISEIYFKTNILDSAYYYNRIHSNSIDSLYQSGLYNKMNEVNLAVDLSYKEREIEISKLQLEKAQLESKHKSTFFIIAISCALLIIAVIIYEYRRKVKDKRKLIKANELLNIQKIELEQKQKDLENEIEIRKKTEEEKEKLLIELRDSKAQIEKKAQKLADANFQLIVSEKQLKELNATKDKFFSIIAHDIKSPLSAFKSVTDLMSDSFFAITEKEQYDFIVLMKNSVNNLLDLLENLLTWSRSQRNTITFEPDSVLLKYIVETAVSQTSSFAEKKNVNIISNIPENIFVFADFNMINTVLRNLINNSVKFSYENGKICIDVKEKKKIDDSTSKSNYITISVKDNGVGIEEKDIDKLFRLDVNHTTLGTSKEKGTGLGLILCKEFIEKHNGKIWVESKPNEGTTFYFTLLKT